MQRHFQFVALLISGVLVGSLVVNPQASLEREQALAYFSDESRIDELLVNLSRKYRAQDFVIRDVKLISTREGRAIPKQNVLVEGGRITQVGPSVSIKVPPGLRVLNGSGAYLSPGLTDMHVHQLVSSSQHLLNLMQGVTTVRDMDGFPWTLKMRERVR